MTEINRNKLRQETVAFMTDGWSRHERTHFDDWLEEEVKPYYSELYRFIKEGEYDPTA